jgi:hypothetical protein
MTILDRRVWGILPRRHALLPVAVLAIASWSDVWAGPIVYVKPDANGAPRLWQIYPDGTGNRPININLPGPDRPKWSHNGRLLAMTSSDPGRFQFSRNVYGIDVLLGEVRQHTFFEDTVIFNPDLQSNYSVAWFKAFSPDNARLAVSRFVHVQSNNVNAVNPYLQVFSTGDGAFLNQPNIGAALDGWNVPGAGLDWSPAANVLVHPTAMETPTGFVTSLRLFDPSGGGLQQITFPQAFIQQFPILVGGSENDYAPAFSPNGSQIAYFRSREVLTGLQRSLSDVSLRIVNADGTNDHEVADFSPGVIPQQVSWSPDGSQLAFDLGQQKVESGVPSFEVLPATVETWIINADGSESRRLLAAPAAFPAWSPLFEVITLPGDFSRDGAVDAADYVIWRKTFGQTVPNGFGADGTGNGTVDPTDFFVWGANFGRGAVSGAAAARSEAVPEACAAVLLLVGFPLAGPLFRRRRKGGQVLVRSEHWSVN